MKLLSKKKNAYLAMMVGLALGSSSLTAYAAPDLDVNAMPTGGSVAIGSIKVDDGNAINKGSIGELTGGNTISALDNSVIDWKTFNIGSAATLNYQLNSHTLVNRVTSSGAEYISQIMGKLNSFGGTLVVANPNGIITGKDSAINADVMLTTMNLTPAQWNTLMAGKSLGSATVDLTNKNNSSGVVINGNVTGDLRVFANTIKIADGVTITGGELPGDDYRNIKAGADVLLFAANNINVGSEIKTDRRGDGKGDEGQYKFMGVDPTKLNATKDNTITIGSDSGGVVTIGYQPGGTTPIVGSNGTLAVVGGKVSINNAKITSGDATVWAANTVSASSSGLNVATTEDNTVNLNSTSISTARSHIGGDGNPREKGELQIIGGKVSVTGSELHGGRDGVGIYAGKKIVDGLNLKDGTPASGALTLEAGTNNKIELNDTKVLSDNGVDPVNKNYANGSGSDIPYHAGNISVVGGSVVLNGTSSVENKFDKNIIVAAGEKYSFDGKAKKYSLTGNSSNELTENADIKQGGVNLSSANNAYTTWNRNDKTSNFIDTTRPTNGKVMVGTVTGINEDGSITFTLDKVGTLSADANAIVKWDRYNLGKGYTLNYDLKNNSTFVNYVTNKGATYISNILGTINSSGGTLVIANPNGIVTGNGSIINADSILLTTAGFTDKQWATLIGEAGSMLTGSYALSGNVTLGENSKVAGSLEVVAGTIKVSDGVQLTENKNTSNNENYGGVTMIAANKVTTPIGGKVHDLFELEAVTIGASKANTITWGTADGAGVKNGYKADSTTPVDGKHSTMLIGGKTELNKSDILAENVSVYTANNVTLGEVNDDFAVTSFTADANNTATINNSKISATRVNGNGNDDGYLDIWAGKVSANDSTLSAGADGIEIFAVNKRTVTKDKSGNYVTTFTAAATNTVDLKGTKLSSVAGNDPINTGISYEGDEISIAGGKVSIDGGSIKADEETHIAAFSTATDTDGDHKGPAIKATNANTVNLTGNLSITSGTNKMKDGINEGISGTNDIIAGAVNIGHIDTTAKIGKADNPNYLTIDKAGASITAKGENGKNNVIAGTYIDIDNEKYTGAAANKVSLVNASLIGQNNIIGGSVDVNSATTMDKSGFAYTHQINKIMAVSSIAGDNYSAVANNKVTIQNQATKDKVVVDPNISGEETRIYGGSVEMKAGTVFANVDMMAFTKATDNIVTSASNQNKITLSGGDIINSGGYAYVTGGAVDISGKSKGDTRISANDVWIQGMNAEKTNKDGTVSKTSAANNTVNINKAGITATGDLVVWGGTVNVTNADVKNAGTGTTSIGAVSNRTYSTDNWDMPQTITTATNNKVTIDNSDITVPTDGSDSSGNVMIGGGAVNVKNNSSVTGSVTQVQAFSKVEPNGETTTYTASAANNVTVDNSKVTSSAKNYVTGGSVTIKNGSNIVSEGITNIFAGNTFKIAEDTATSFNGVAGNKVDITGATVNSASDLLVLGGSVNMKNSNVSSTDGKVDVRAVSSIASKETFMPILGTDGKVDPSSWYKFTETIYTANAGNKFSIAGTSVYDKKNKVYNINNYAWLFSKDSMNIKAGSISIAGDGSVGIYTTGTGTINKTAGTSISEGHGEVVSKS